MIGPITKGIAGLWTQVLMQNYADRSLVLVTQVAKVGSLVQASIPATSPLPPYPSPEAQPDSQHPPLPPTPPSIQLTPLFGAAKSEHARTLQNLYASQIATLVWSHEAQGAGDGAPRRNVVVGLALKPAPNLSKKGEEKAEEDGPLSVGERVVFHGIMDMVKEILATKEQEQSSAARPSSSRRRVKQPEQSDALKENEATAS